MKKVIFDLDGTLYKLPIGGFGRSRLYEDIRKKAYKYIGSSLEVDSNEAASLYEYILEKYDGEVSLGLETEYGMDRYDYFGSTWNLDPANYIEPAQAIEEMTRFTGNALLLTAAPRVWAERALGYLGLTSIFDDLIITGEPDIRKPDPAVFRQAASLLGTFPENIISVGDQNYSDILPAKNLGMTTILIGGDRQDADFKADDLADAINIIKEKIL